MPRLSKRKILSLRGAGSQGDEERFLQALNVIGSDTPQYLTGYEFV